ncbi:MAG TPA: MoxR family ATPase [Thermoanaerobaculia bacterium]|nr:MoxR family ATPase [Thermoanaerobaculia bacterium]
MQPDTGWYRYKGDGSTPPGAPYDSRGERGRYLASPELVTAVNTALTVEQPLLVVGESGTGKTMLAWSVASELGLLPVLHFHTRTDHRARDVLFTIDNLARFYDAQIGDAKAKELGNYTTYGPLGEAILDDRPRVVLIDEIDKAPRDFPNDLLDEIDQMEFSPPDRSGRVRAKHRPIVIITSNNERQLPDPFLRRCIFHYIEFPEREALQRILHERLAHLDVEHALVDAATQRFLDLRDRKLNLEKQPATGELLVWVKMLLRAGVDPQKLRESPLAEIPYIGALLKNKSDLDTVRKSAA